VELVAFKLDPVFACYLLKLCRSRRFVQNIVYRHINFSFGFVLIIFIAVIFNWVMYNQDRGFRNGRYGRIGVCGDAWVNSIGKGPQHIDVRVTENFGEVNSYVM
jgi:hypothetical protein